MISPTNLGDFFQFSLGDVAVVVTLITALWKGGKWFTGIQKWLDVHEIEHEILIRDYVSRHNITVEDLPTRKRKR
jgi:hypothetical protein